MQASSVESEIGRNACYDGLLRYFYVRLLHPLIFCLLCIALTDDFCALQHSVLPTTSGGVNKHRFVLWSLDMNTYCLASEAIKGAALSFEGVHHIERCDGLSASVLGVCDSVTDNILKEDFQYASGFLVDETGDTFYATSASKAADGRFRNALDVVSEDLSVPFGTALA